MSIRIKGQDKDSTLRENTTKASLVSAKDGVGATQSSLGTYHMADNANLYEIQRTNNFEFIIMFGAAATLNDAGLTLPYDVDNADDWAQEVLRMSVSEASIPHFTQSPIAIKRGNSTIKYAGTPEFSDGSLTLNDYIGADTKSILMAWQSQSYDVKTEKVGLATDYKKTAQLIEYSPDLQKVRSWTLYGCWITSISEPNYNSDDSGKHNIQVGIAYDKAVIDVD